MAKAGTVCRKREETNNGETKDWEVYIGGK